MTDKVKKAIEQLERVSNSLASIGETVDYTDIAIQALEQQPKSGKWIDIGATHSQCDKCLAVFEIVSANGEANFCPNCGADMRKSEDKG